MRSFKTGGATFAEYNTRTLILKYRIQICMVVISLIAYFLLVYSTRHFFGDDLSVTQVAWWDYLLQYGWHGISTLNSHGGDYTTIWYFLIVALEKMWGGWGGHLYFPLEYYIKAMAVFFSIISAVTMFFLIKHFRPKSCYLPTVIACATLFSPAFLLDILKANLPDSLYLSFMLLSLLCFVKRKTGSAWFLCIVGACFKLMAIYLIPVYIWFYLKNFKTDSLYEKIKPFIFSFLALLICSLPNIITGGSFKDAIVTPILERSNAMMNSYSLSIWNFLPNNHKDFHLFAITLTGLTFIILFIFLKSFVRKEHYAAIEFPVLLTLSPLICYFFLPAQHEAYFASATIFAVLGAVIMLNKKFFGIAVALNALFFYIYSLIISMISKAMNTIDLLSSGRLLFQLLTLVYIAIVGSLLQEIWRNSRLYKQTTS